MDLKKLMYFVRISEDGSLTRAAGVLRIAQPALSRQLRLLEEELGTKLFNRTKRGMTLTQDGDLLYNSIVGPLRDLERSLLTFRSYTSGIDGVVSIGMPPQLSYLLGPQLLLRMQKLAPKVKLRIVDGYSGQLRDLVARGIIHFALLEGEWGQISSRLFEVYCCGFLLIGPASAGFTSIETIGFKEAVRFPLIVPCQPFGVRGVLNEAALRNNVVINAAVEVDSPATTLKMLEAGEAYSVMPSIYLENSGPANTACVSIPQAELAMRFVLISGSVNGGASQAIQGLEGVLRETFMELFRELEEASDQFERRSNT